MRAADGSPVVIGLKFPGGGHAVVGYDLQYDATLQNTRFKFMTAPSLSIVHIR